MMAAVQVTPITTSGTVDRFKRSSPRPPGSSTILIDLPHMGAAEALAFARKNPHAVLATMKRDRTPQLSPVLVGVDSQDRLVVSTRESAIKTLNVRRDPRAWLCVLNDRFFGNWAQLSGDVEVVSLPEAMEPLVEYYRSISGEHPDWDDYRTAMIKQRRCLIRVTPTKAGPTVFG
jgi:PPOX class probable F420-dependent enzyme